MRVISVDVARASWLFPLTELNPTGRNFTAAFAGLTQRYNFKKYPKHSLDFDPEAKGLIFEEGDFKNRDGINIIVKLSVFADGVVSDAWSSTRDAEDFLKDALQWLKAEHGFGLPPDRPLRTLYLSQLTVAMDKNPATAIPKLQPLMDLVSSKTAETDRPTDGFMFAGFSFWAKDWNKPGAPGAYRFEIKAGSIPNENRYFAAAALPTEAHVETLNELERLLD